jgi:hypothetical protein
LFTNDGLEGVDLSKLSYKSDDEDEVDIAKDQLERSMTDEERN